ncbi:MAG: TRAP transporter small permease subunit [Propionibacteriales bacterium]|nr:TRAP transporter small permease subunit [Propionibacteriales bacterium]
MPAQELDGKRLTPRGALRTIVRMLSIVAGVALLFVLLTTTADVAKRNLGGGSIPWAIEYNEIMLVALVFLSLANTQRTGDHVSVVLVTARIPHRARCVIRGVGMVVAAVFVGWMLYRSWQVGLQSYRTGEYRIGLAQVPVWPARLLIPVGLVFLLLQMLVNIYDDVVGFFRGKPEEVGEDAGDERSDATKAATL